MDYQTEQSYINSGILILIGLNVECNKSAMLVLTSFKILKVIKSLDGNLYKNAANGEKHMVKGQVKVENNKVYGSL